MWSKPPAGQTVTFEYFHATLGWITRPVSNNADGITQSPDFLETVPDATILVRIQSRDGSNVLKTSVTGSLTVSGSTRTFTNTTPSTAGAVPPIDGLTVSTVAGTSNWKLSWNQSHAAVIPRMSIRTVLEDGTRTGWVPVSDSHFQDPARRALASGKDTYTSAAGELPRGHYELELRFEVDNVVIGRSTIDLQDNNTYGRVDMSPGAGTATQLAGTFTPLADGSGGWELKWPVPTDPAIVAEVRNLHALPTDPPIPYVIENGHYVIRSPGNTEPGAYDFAVNHKWHGVLSAVRVENSVPSTFALIRPNTS